MHEAGNDWIGALMPIVLVLITLVATYYFKSALELSLKTETENILKQASNYFHGIFLKIESSSRHACEQRSLATSGRTDSREADARRELHRVQNASASKSVHAQVQL